MIKSLREWSNYKLLVWICVVILFVIPMFQAINIFMNPGWLLEDDFLDYWAAGRLNLDGDNPYDPTNLQSIQNNIIPSESGPIMMWNPPWFLPIAMVFGSLTYPIARFLWFLLTIAVLCISVFSLWQLNGGTKDTRLISLVIGFTFLPVFYCIIKGQVSMFLLLGLVGFLYFSYQGNGWMAGISLALLAIKPHIVYLFLIVVPIWAVYYKKWSTLFGVIATLLVATIIPVISNHEVLNQYIYTITNIPPTNSATPTFGSIIRVLLRNRNYLLQLIPSFLGIIWILYYWWLNRLNWDWLKQAPLIVLVSLLTTPYAWIWDQNVALIALIQIGVLLLLAKDRYLTVLVVSTYILLEILEFSIKGGQFWTFWFAPALLIFYLASRNILQSKITNSRDNVIS